MSCDTRTPKTFARVRFFLSPLATAPPPQPSPTNRLNKSTEPLESPPPLLYTYIMTTEPSNKKPTSLEEIPDLPSTQKVFVSDPKNILTRTRPDGLLESIDIVTGTILAISSSDSRAAEVQASSPFLQKDFVEVVMPSGEKLLVDRTVDLSLISSDFSTAKLSNVLKDRIFDLVASGKSLYSLSKMKAMPPYSLLLRWYHKYEDFRSIVDTARRFRGEYLYDRIMENVDRLENDSLSKTEVEAITSATNFLKWGAEVSDPLNYAHKKDASQGGVTIVVNTGIDRTQQTTTIEVKPTENKKEDENDT